MIALTFTTSNIRAAREEFDTDDLGEALAQFGHKHFGSDDRLDTWVFALAVERGDARLSRDEIAQKLADLARIEEFRALDAERMATSNSAKDAS